MADLALYAGAAVLILLGLHRWARVRGGRGAQDPPPALVYAYRFTWCLGSALVVLDGRTAALVRRWVPVPGAGMLAGDELRLTAACFLGLLALALADPRPPAAPVRRRVAGWAVAAAAEAGFFLASGLRSTGGELWTSGTGHRLALAAYDAVQTGYLGGCLPALARQTLRGSRRAGGGALRMGLRLIGWAVAVGVVWTAWGLDDVWLALRDGGQSAGEDRVSVALGLLCVGLLACGGTASAWARGVAPLGRWWRARRRYAALTPLWDALYAAFPQIALAPPGRRAAFLMPRDARFALYRRVIEIRDGLLLLRPYLAAVPSGPEEHRARAEAEAVRAALDRAAGGGSPSAVPGDAAGPDQPFTGVGHEADWLALVAREFTRVSRPVPIRRVRGGPSPLRRDRPPHPPCRDAR